MPRGIVEEEQPGWVVRKAPRGRWDLLRILEQEHTCGGGGPSGRYHPGAEGAGGVQASLGGASLTSVGAEQRMKRR